MITIRINSLIALVTVIILISSFEIQRGVLAIEQVIPNKVLQQLFNIYFIKERKKKKESF